MRCVSSVANCWLVSPVVRWLGNGLSGVALRIFVVIYPQFLPLVGPLSSWWVRGGSLLLNKPQRCATKRFTKISSIHWSA